MENLKENYLGLAAALLRTTREDLTSKDYYKRKDGRDFLKTPLAEAIFSYFDIDIQYFKKKTDLRRKTKQVRHKAQI